MTNPRVSVIVATYNLETVIRKSLETLLNQTYQDFEIIVCDDCSQDMTYEILTELADKNDKIVILRNDKNSGQAFARNRCFSVAKGEYFAIHDGDDFSLAGRLKLQVEFLDKNPEYALVSGLMYMMNDKGELSESHGGTGEKTKYDFLWGIPFSHPSTMFRSSTIKQVGGYKVDPATRYRGEDYDMFVRIYALGMKGYVLNELIYTYYAGLEAFKRRKYKYRISEAKVRYRSYKVLGLLPKGYLYVLKPLVVGLIPKKLLMSMIYKNAKQLD